MNHKHLAASTKDYIKLVYYRIDFMYRLHKLFVEFCCFVYIYVKNQFFSADFRFFVRKKNQFHVFEFFSDINEKWFFRRPVKYERLSSIGIRKTLPEPLKTERSLQKCLGSSSNSLIFQYLHHTKHQSLASFSSFHSYQ